jgi:hypothetical protein
VPIVDLGRHHHFGTAILGANRTVRWFLQLAAAS